MADLIVNTAEGWGIPLALEPDRRATIRDFRRGGKKSISHESRLGYNCACLLYVTDGPENCLIAGPISGTNVGA